MKSLEEFVNEAAKKKSPAGKYFKNTVLYNGAADTRAAIEEWILGYYATSNSSISPILAIASAIDWAEEFIDKAISKFPEDNEVKEYKDNLKKLQKLINDNFKK